VETGIVFIGIVWGRPECWRCGCTTARDFPLDEASAMGMSMSIWTLNNELSPAREKKARSWVWKYPLVGPGMRAGGGVGGNMAIRSCPVGGEG
jgi:hypothetical protein